jgi:hypothetical protein
LGDQIMPNQLLQEVERMNLDQVRSNIERIIASYRHSIDIFAELIQNSTDAIIEKVGFDHLERGSIALEVWPNQRKLTIRDNGVGIAESDLSSVLVNGKSLKRERHTGKYGFMGFGLTFVGFQTTYFRIESIHDGRKASRTYSDLYKFIYEGSELPTSQEEGQEVQSEPSQEDTGTTITAIFPSCFPDPALEQTLSDIFGLTANVNAFVAALRTRSAVGLLEPLFSGTQNFAFELRIEGTPVPVTNSFLTTREIVQILFPTETRLLDIDQDFQPLVALSESMPESQKNDVRRCVLLDKKIQNVQIGTNAPLTARIFISCTSKEHLNKYNEDILLRAPGVEGGFLIENGLWLALNGMPTGICLEAFGHATYLPFTVIIDIQNLEVRKELDAGRKGISEYRVGQIRDKIGDLLRENNFIKYRRHVVGADPRIANPMYDPRQALLSRYSEKTRYNIDLIQPSLPPLEEQEVVTLFIELLARGHLKGYEQKVVSGYQVYDGLYSYNLSPTPESLLSATVPHGVSRSVFDLNDGVLRKDILIELGTPVESYDTWRFNNETPNGVMEREQDEEVKAGRTTVRSWGGGARSEAEGDDDRDRTGRRWGEGWITFF